MFTVEQQEWFTAQEAAAFLRVGRSTIYRMSEANQLRSHVLPSGRGRRFHRSDLEAALQVVDHDKKKDR